MSKKERVIAGGKRKEILPDVPDIEVAKMVSLKISIEAYLNDHPVV